MVNFNKKSGEVDNTIGEIKLKADKNVCIT